MIPKKLHRVIIALNRELGLTWNGRLNEKNCTDSIFSQSPAVVPIVIELSNENSNNCNTSAHVIVDPVVTLLVDPWKNLLVGSKMASKGAELGFINPLVKDGRKVAQLQQKELDSMADKWQAAIVMYVVGESPTIPSVKRFMAAVWSNVTQPHVFYHDEGYFILKFANVEDKNTIVVGGPYTFYGKPVIIKPWVANFNFYEEVLKVIPLWVKFPNLPLNCWGSDSLSRISSLLGVSLFADGCTTRQERVSFARVLIEMDVTNPLPDHVWIEDTTGKAFKKPVLYDWKPQFCKPCNIVGHDCDKIQKAKPVKPAVKKVWVPKQMQQAEQPQVVSTNAHTPPHTQVVPQASGNVDWKIVTRRTKGPSRMRNMSPSNPFTALSSDLGLKEITDGDMTEVGDDHTVIQAPNHEEALIETRVKETKFKKISSKFGRYWSWGESYKDNPRGRIWLGWQHLEVDLSILTCHEQFIHCVVRDRSGCVYLYFTAVYGLHTIEDRKRLWSALLQIQASVGAYPWILSGDFNTILADGDRINGCPVTAAETCDFNNFAVSAGLCVLQSVGDYFSWHKGASEGKVASRIDWCLGNPAWAMKFSGVPMQYLNFSISDHVPLMISCLPDVPEGGKPFRFLNFLAHHTQFAPLVKAVWDSPGAGSCMFQLWCKLKQVKCKLKSLHREEFVGIAEKIDKARTLLASVQQDLVTAPTTELHLQEIECIADLRKWLKVDEIALRQKSRIQWLQVGDSNHHYFFSSLKERNRINRISILYDAKGNKLVYDEAIQKEVISFYKALLGSSAPSLPSVHLPTLRKGPTLSVSAKKWLIRQVTNDEIDLALKAIGDDKAPGLDGLNAVFFKKSWHIIKEDVYRAVKELFLSNTMLPQFNTTSITLVPKVLNPTLVKYFRPIACCNVVYKLVSKVLTTRMQTVISEVVNEAQSGFIPGRQIADNILLATELIKGYIRSHVSPRCMLKVDLKKAYDSIEWPFLKDLMLGLGFPECFVGWVMACITTVSYSILINGSPTLPFRARKGLRQGDPMSPFLFALGMEYLTRHLQHLQSLPDFNFHPRCEKLAITHLMFADDLLIFARADPHSVLMLFDAFSKFSKASGLEANLDKSNIYIGGVNASERRAIVDLVHIPEGQFPFRYLDVPLSIKKLVYNQCRPLIDKVISRDKTWTARNLSYAGRLQLVQSILLSLQAYWCQIFILPKKVIKEIQNYCRIFLWTGHTDPSRKSLVVWHRLCLPRSAGGWNLKEMSLWNKAVVSKLLWALTHKMDKLWCRWVHAYYIKGRFSPLTNMLLLLEGGMQLPTKDRLLQWKVVTDDLCPLCSKCPESVSHLFFHCEFAAGRTGDRHKLLLMYFAKCVYGIWIQRNEMVFNHKCRDPKAVLQDVKFRVAFGGRKKGKVHGLGSGSPLYYAPPLRGGGSSSSYIPSLYSQFQQQFTQKTQELEATQAQILREREEERLERQREKEELQREKEELQRERDAERLEHQREKQEKEENDRAQAKVIAELKEAMENYGRMFNQCSQFQSQDRRGPPGGGAGLGTPTG
ncbi:uncharacterized protein [Spinacia oleracea]|uniref:Reverse transcriptase domain-containing protein n=1 Tax=Spinacia oleracea TaxID=3562 RepID=A0ABM3QXL1_SPIOL|nr:uncharacterized protein LOC130463083 [Spinacia oleracea]